MMKGAYGPEDELTSGEPRVRELGYSASQAESWRRRSSRYWRRSGSAIRRTPAISSATAISAMRAG
jgi:hypothetical protein